MQQFLIKEEIPKEPIFIVSSGRSGTTLLRSILNRTNQIYIPFEADFIARGYPYFGKIKEFKEHNIIQVVNLFIRASLGDGWEMDRKYLIKALKYNKPTSFAHINHIIYSSYLKHTGIPNKTWAIKTPVLIENMDRVVKTFPNAKIIHLVRDGRDVCVSFKNVHKSLPDSEKFGPKSTLANALYWVDGLRRIESYKHHKQLFELRYEDIINTPEQTIASLLKFLEIPFDSSILSNENDDVRQVLNKHRDTIHKNIGKPLLKTNIHKYKEQMARKDKWLYEFIANPFLKKYGYKIEFKFSSSILLNLIRYPMYLCAQLFNNYKNRKKDRRYYAEAMKLYS